MRMPYHLNPMFYAGLAVFQGIRVGVRQGLGMSIYRQLWEWCRIYDILITITGCSLRKAFHTRCGGDPAPNYA